MRSSSALAQIALAATFVCGIASPIAAQTRVVKAPAAVLASPRGSAIGSVRPGIELRVLETRGSYVRVSVDGYVERARLSAQRGSARTRVGPRNAVIRSRAATSARTVGSFDAGTTVSLGKGTVPKGWVKVSRTGWVLGSVLERPAAPPAKMARARPSAEKASAGEVETPAGASRTRAATSTAAAKAAAPARGVASAAATPSSPATTPAASVGAATAAAPAAAPLGDSALVPTSNVALRAAPDARALATIAQGTTLVPLARERGWVRVRVEGWVPERDVAPADTTVRTAVSAADLRADPQGSKGRVVRWNVQIFARQTADPLRRDLAVDETYLLARGPGEENALLYLVVPPALLESTKSIPALAEAVITARVRTGKSELVGVPILDLLTIAARK